ncbi:MAG: hypothetical protein AB7G47_14875 [Mycolicibacterium sp.]|uniref:hypothetical protein n=1 Tax=Mycolicibacterium sp. TaxID=2320850 RepID=UPI003D10D143
MPNTPLVLAIAAAGLIVAGISTGTAWAGGPGGDIEDHDHISEAIGTGVFEGELIGFHATGDTNDEASAAVIAVCQAAGGVECTADQVTNDDLCIVSVADEASSVVAGGAGVTVEAARADALQRAAANNMPLAPNSPIVLWDCH